MEVSFFGNNHQGCLYDARNALCDHIIRGTIHKADQHCLDDPVDPTVMQANVFGTRAVLMSVRDGCLVNGEENGCLRVEVAKDLKDEVAKPQCLLTPTACVTQCTCSQW